MKAKEANKIATNYLINNSDLSYNTIINKIKEASSKGEFSITIYKRLSKIVIDRLKKDGYEVKEYFPFMSPKDEYLSTIIW